MLKRLVSNILQNFKNKPVLWVVVVGFTACVVVAICLLAYSKGDEWKGIDTSLTDIKPEYIALISEAKDVLEHPEIYNDYMGERHFSDVFYIHYDPLFQILGYLLQDIDGDGSDELIFGENDVNPEGSWNGVVYDMYTISDGQVVHVLNGWERNRYYLSENGVIINEFSNSANESGCYYYKFVGQDLELIEGYVENIDNDGNRVILYDTADQVKEISEKEKLEIQNKYTILYPKFVPFIAVP